MEDDISAGEDCAASHLRPYAHHIHNRAVLETDWRFLFRNSRKFTGLRPQVGSALWLKWTHDGRFIESGCLLASAVITLCLTVMRAWEANSCGNFGAQFWRSKQKNTTINGCLVKSYAMQLFKWKNIWGVRWSHKSIMKKVQDCGDATAGLSQTKERKQTCRWQNLEYLRLLVGTQLHQSDDYPHSIVLLSVHLPEQTRCRFYMVSFVPKRSDISQSLFQLLHSQQISVDSIKHNHPTWGCLLLHRSYWGREVIFFLLKRTQSTFVFNRFALARFPPNTIFRTLRESPRQEKEWRSKNFAFCSLAWQTNSLGR